MHITQSDHARLDLFSRMWGGRGLGPRNEVLRDNYSPVFDKVASCDNFVWISFKRMHGKLHLPLTRINDCFFLKYNLLEINFFKQNIDVATKEILASSQSPPSSPPPRHRRHQALLGHHRLRSQALPRHWTAPWTLAGVQISLVRKDAQTSLGRLRSGQGLCASFTLTCRLPN